MLLIGVAVGAFLWARGRALGGQRTLSRYTFSLAGLWIVCSASLASFLELHHMTGRMKYLIGSASQLAPIWRAWHVAAVRDPTSRKLVTHSSVTYGISASGKLMTLYGPTFRPTQIVHDVPELMGS